MSRFDFKTQPLLSPEYQAALEPLQGVLDDLEMPRHPDQLLSLQLLPMVVKQPASAIGFTRYVREQARHAGEPQSAVESLQVYTVFKALESLGGDLQLRSILQISTMNKGTRVASGDTEGAEKVDEMIDKLILARARHNSTTLLQAYDILHLPFDEVEHPQLWTHVQDVHRDQPRVKAPVRIDAEEGLVFDALRIQARDISPLSSSEDEAPKRRRLFKGPVASFAGNLATGLYRLASGESSTDYMIECMDTKLLAKLPPRLDLTPDQMTRVMRTGSKVRQYVSSAAIIDPAITRDPRARFAVYMGENLKGTDVKAERAYYDIMAKKVTRSERKVIERIERYLARLQETDEQA